MDRLDETEVIPCSGIVHRALLRKDWIDEDSGQVKSAAFLRRREMDGRLKEIGLSVDRAALQSVQDFARSFKKCYGVVSLHTGRIRDIQLDVIPASYPDNPSHAEIIGFPDDAPAEEERLAGLLARQSRLRWQP